MLQLAAKIPREIVIAFSGGADSSALVSFCERGKKKITLLHIDHKTSHSRDAKRFVEAYAKEFNLPLVVREVPENMKHDEAAWRDVRLDAYREFTSKGLFVATAHHADDNLEWTLMTTIHGKPKFMNPIDHEHKLIKPFLYCDKQELIDWCQKFDVPFITDPTNDEGDTNARAILRKNVIPHLLRIHPGMKTSIKRKMMEANAIK